LGYLACSSFSNAEEVCPSGTVGLCDPAVIETVVESVEVTTQNDGAGVLTTTVTTTTTTTDTVINTDSGDILASGSGYVSSGKEGDMDSDWGGQGPASMPSGNSCGDLGADKCAMITGSGNSTSTMGVSGMGTTFINTVNISDMNIEDGGEVNYTIKVDKQDSADSIYMHITGKDGSTVKFAGTDILSAAGVNSGYASYSGGFDFSDNLTTLIIEVGGRDINLAVGPMFDDVTINVIYNVVSQIVQQTITTVEQYVYLNSDATQEELDIVENIFDNNAPIEQPDGGFDLEPIDNNTSETSYETVELELDFEIDIDIPDIEIDFDMQDVTIEAPVTAVDVEAEMELDIMPPPEPQPAVEAEVPVENTESPVEPEVKTEAEPVEKVEVAEAENNEPVEEVKEESSEEVKEEPKEEVKEEPKEEPKEEKKQEVKEEPKKEIKITPKKETKPKTKQQKKEEKQKAGTKIVKKMGDKGRYDSTNQLKTLIVMNVIADTKSFFSAQKQLKEVEGFFTDATLPDSNIPDNNLAAYLLYAGDGGIMNDMINLQYE